MQWPSTSIAHGGILHPAKASYSPDTHKLLKVLMEESRMTMRQRKKIDYYLRSGESLPLPEASQSASDLTPTRRPPRIVIRPGTSKRRSKDAILKSGAYERERFRPKPRLDREKEKKRLQNHMAYNKDVEPKPPVVRLKTSQSAVEFNRFDQLVQEIQEREEWLKQMEELGEAHKHRLLIQQQIEARVREMEQLTVAE